MEVIKQDHKTNYTVFDGFIYNNKLT